MPTTWVAGHMWFFSNYVRPTLKLFRAYDFQYIYVYNKCSKSK